MEKTLAIINGLKQDRVIRDYALGGAFALLFYTEPALTYDLDVFVFLPTSDPAKKIAVLSPLYEALQSRGYQPDKEHIIIEGVPVQFILAYNPLVEEAVREATEQTYKGIKTRVVQLEHLLAILLDTGRPKDRARILQLTQTVPIRKKLLGSILERYGLKKKWENQIEKS